jgi:ABC-type transporter Mla subunit MlaD
LKELLKRRDAEIEELKDALAGREDEIEELEESLESFMGQCQAQEDEVIFLLFQSGKVVTSMICRSNHYVRRIEWILWHR